MPIPKGKIMAIHFYKKYEAYGEFSNFSDHGFHADGEYWKTVEHYFQGQKYEDPAQRKRVAEAENPMIAKKRGQEPGLRAGWDAMRDDVMRVGVLKKFEEYPDLKALLLSTGEEEIVEAAPTDYYWGAGKDGSGKNMLGKILVETRTILRERETE